MPAKSPPENLENAIADYLSGMSHEVAARRNRVSYGRLSLALNDRGLRRTPEQLHNLRSDRLRERWRGHRHEFDPTEIARLYELGESEKSLAVRFGVNRNVIRRHLLETGARIRNVTEANRLMMSRRTPHEHAANTRAAHAASRGRKATFEERVRRAQGVEARQSNRSPAERELASWLRERGVDTVAQKAIGPYNADLTFETVAVEIFGGAFHAHGRHRKRSGRRTRYVLDQGWNLVFVWVDELRWPLRQSLADYLIAFAEETGTDPSKRGQYRVVWGGGEPVPEGSFYFHNGTGVPAFGTPANGRS